MYILGYKTLKAKHNCYFRFLTIHELKEITQFQKFGNNVEYNLLFSGSEKKKLLATA